MTGGPSALARCISVPVGEFAGGYWGERALLSPRASLPRDFTDLFTVDAVDELIAERGLRTPFIRMAKEGAVLPPGRFTAPGGYGAEVADQVDSAKVLAEFAAGATIVLQGLHRTWSPLRAFTRALVAELGHPAQVNAYVTPAANRGFDPHYDVHDVFVLQISGEKRWVIHEPAHPLPFADEPWGEHGAAVRAKAEGTPAIDTVLRPGDALYLPRGWIHSATALGGTTVHLTIGVPATTMSDLAREAVAAALRAPALRGSLPLGIDVGDADAIAPLLTAATDALVAALHAGDPVHAATTLGARFERSTRPAPVRPLAAVEAARDLAAADRIVWRDGLAARVDTDGDGARIRLRDRTLRLPPQCGRALEALLAGDVHAAGRLAGLDEPDSLTIARRLLREGVVVPAP